MLIQAHAIAKRYGTVQALKDVSASFGPAEVHALVGENGSGKSTLAKIFAGLIHQDTGTVTVGDNAGPRNPREAVGVGIAMVSQEGGLAADLTVAENLLAARLPTRAGRVVWRQVYRDAQTLLDGLGVDIQSRSRVGDLRIDQQQMVEVVRAIALDPKLLILDEATSSLTEDQVATVFDALAPLKRGGTTVIFISHRLDEVREVADRITVLRDGAVVSVLEAPSTVDNQTLVTQMVGRPPSDFYHKVHVPTGAEVLRVEHLTTRRLHDISLSIGAGEIVGIAGLVGSGRTSLAETLFGMWHVSSGSVTVAAERVRLRKPEHAIEAGLALVPEDRKRSGLVLGASIAANLTMCCHAEMTRAGMFVKRRELALARDQMEALSVKAPGPATVVRNLSGGNQQKVVLGRWLATRPKVLLLDEPARGMDVGAKSDLFERVGSLVVDGMAVLFISSEIPDLIALADRIIVLYEGRVVGEVDARSTTEEEVGHLVAGAHTHGTGGHLV